MNSYEQDRQAQGADAREKKIDFSLLKYFWQAGPLNFSKQDSIPRFLRKIKVLKNFSDGELFILSKYLNERNFRRGEVIFQQGDIGIGFYLIFSGQVEISVDDNKFDIDENIAKGRYSLNLERYDFFGELALLQENAIRNATAIAKEDCILFGIFRPDLDDLILQYPVVAARLLQSVSMIIANRLFFLTQEVRFLKTKLENKESNK